MMPWRMRRARARRVRDGGVGGCSGGALSLGKVPARVARLRTLLAMPRTLHAPALTRLADALCADAARNAAGGKQQLLSKG